jgi:hypothetical protein
MTGHTAGSDDRMALHPYGAEDSFLASAGRRISRKER